MSQSSIQFCSYKGIKIQLMITRNQKQPPFVTLAASADMALEIVNVRYRNLLKSALLVNLQTDPVLVSIKSFRVFTKPPE